MCDDFIVRNKRACFRTTENSTRNRHEYRHHWKWEFVNVSVCRFFFHHCRHIRYSISLDFNLDLRDCWKGSRIFIYVFSCVFCPSTYIGFSWLILLGRIESDRRKLFELNRLVVACRTSRNYFHLAHVNQNEIHSIERERRTCIATTLTAHYLTHVKKEV